MSQHNNERSALKHKWVTAARVRGGVYLALGICVSLVLTISTTLAISKSFSSLSLSSLQSISGVLLTVEGILLALVVLVKDPFTRVLTGFLSLMALLFSLDTLMLTTVASQLSGGSVNSAIDVLTPYTITPLSLFQWNLVFFAALVVSYFSRAIRADLEKIRLKDRKGGERSQQTTL